MENKNNLFFCYSNRLHLFLEAFGVIYINKNINKNTKKAYYVYKRSEKLGFLLEEWENMKGKIKLKDAVKRKDNI